MTERTTMTAADTEFVIAELHGLKRGQKLVYYRGDLAMGREGHPVVGLLAKEAYRLAKAKRVRLTQRRLGPPNGSRETRVCWPTGRAKGPSFPYIRTTGVGCGFDYIATGA